MIHGILEAGRGYFMDKGSREGLIHRIMEIGKG